MTLLQRYGQDKAWFCIARTHPLRKLCLRVVTHPLFDRLIFAFIVVNSVLLAARDPVQQKRGRQTLRNQLSSQGDLVFTVVFTVEMLIRMTALGVFGEGGYFSDSGWNRLDAFVVLVGYVT